MVCGADHYQTIGKGTSLAFCLACRSNPSPADLAQALELCKKTLETPNPDQTANAWNIIGIIHYRRGDLKEALAALEKAAANSHGYYKCKNDLFLAMTHERLGKKDAARLCYDRAVAWMDKNPPTPELRRFRAEAVSVLGIKEEPKPGSR
jgi:tetratricopeptide (TPR) repeat protein